MPDGYMLYFFQRATFDRYFYPLHVRNVFYNTTIYMKTVSLEFVMYICRTISLMSLLVVRLFKEHKSLVATR